MFDSKLPSLRTRKPHVSQARIAFQSTTAKWASSSGSGRAAFGIGTPSSKPGPWPKRLARRLPDLVFFAVQRVLRDPVARGRRVDLVDRDRPLEEVDAEAARRLLLQQRDVVVVLRVDLRAASGSGWFQKLASEKNRRGGRAGAALHSRVHRTRRAKADRKLERLMVAAYGRARRAVNGPDVARESWSRLALERRALAATTAGFWDTTRALEARNEDAAPCALPAGFARQRTTDERRPAALPPPRQPERDEGGTPAPRFPLRGPGQARDFRAAQLHRLGLALQRPRPRAHGEDPAAVGLRLQLRLRGRGPEELPALRPAQPDRAGDARRADSSHAGAGARAPGAKRDRGVPSRPRHHPDVARLPPRHGRHLRRERDLDARETPVTGVVERADDRRHEAQHRVEGPGRRHRRLPEAAARRARAGALAAVPRDERRLVLVVQQEGPERLQEAVADDVRTLRERSPPRQPGLGLEHERTEGQAERRGVRVPGLLAGWRLRGRAGGRRLPRRLEAVPPRRPREAGTGQADRDRRDGAARPPSRRSPRSRTGPGSCRGGTSPSGATAPSG